MYTMLEQDFFIEGRDYFARCHQGQFAETVSAENLSASINETLERRASGVAHIVRLDENNFVIVYNKK